MSEQGARQDSARGFTARFDDVSLWDLVQFECLRQKAEHVLRVSSQGQIGFLYFREGNVVHATTLRSLGEPALREMLAWPGGSVEPWPARWPERESITAPWQSLLLGAAQAADRGEPPPAAAARPRIELAATAPPPVRRTVEKVALAPNGRVLLGGSIHGLPEAASYAAQMADLMGEFLGLDGFRTLEASLDDQHLTVSRSKDGGLLAQRHRDQGSA